MATDAIQQLIAAVKTIEELTRSDCYSRSHKARQLPDNRVRIVSGLRIMSGYHDRMTPEVEALAERAFNKMKAEERAAGEAERDRLLTQYAADLESLRAILPELAAKASIEIGVIARSLKEEVGSAKEQQS